MERRMADEQAEEKNGGCEITTSPPIDSVPIHIQLLLSQIALSQCKHTLVQQNVFHVHVCVCKMRILSLDSDTRKTFLLSHDFRFIYCLPFLS